MYFYQITRLSFPLCALVDRYFILLFIYLWIWITVPYFYRTHRIIDSICSKHCSVVVTKEANGLDLQWYETSYAIRLMYLWCTTLINVMHLVKFKSTGNFHYCGSLSIPRTDCKFELLFVNNFNPLVQDTINVCCDFVLLILFTIDGFTSIKQSVVSCVYPILDFCLFLILITL